MRGRVKTDKQSTVDLEALWELHQGLEPVRQSASEGMLIAEAKTRRFLYADPAICRMLGYSAEELTQLSVADIHPRESLEYVLSQFEVQARGEKAVASDIPCLRKDGTVMYADVHADPILVDGKQCVLGSFVDTTKRKQAEEEEEKQQYYLTKAQEIGKIGTWELDLIENRLRWTDENYRIFGVPIGTELTYETFLGQVHPDDREYVDRQWKAGVEGKPYDIEHRLLLNGETRWVREKADVTRNDAGQAVSAIGFTQDITERKRAENMKAEHTHLREALIEGFPHPLMLISRDRKVIAANQKALEMGATIGDFCWAEFGQCMFVTDSQREHFGAQGVPMDNTHCSFCAADSCLNDQIPRNDPYVEAFGRIFDTHWTPLDDDTYLHYAIDVTERKEAEERLESERALSNTIIDSLPGLFYIFEETTARFIRRNANWAKITGFSEDELDARTALDTVVDRDLCASRMHEVFDTGSSSMENNLLTKTGEQIPFYFTGDRITLDSKTYLVGTGLDISEIKQAEKELKASEEKWRSLTENSPDHVILTDCDGTIRFINHTVSDLSAEQVTGKSILGFVPEDYRTQIAECFRRVTETQEPGSYETMYAYADGSEGFFETRVSPVIDDGRVEALVLNSRDLTARMRAERELARNEERVRVSTQVAGVAVWEYDVVADQITRSENHDRLYGMEPQGPSGMGIFLNAIHRDDRKSINAEIDRAVAPQSAGRFNADFRVTWPDNSLHCLEVIGEVANRAPDGTATLVRGCLLDITKRKQAEEKLRDAERKSRAWLQNSPICTKVLDPDLILRFMSVAGMEALGIDDATPFYGKPYPFDFYPESFRSQMTRNLEKARNTGESIAQEASVADIEGNELWYHSTIVPVYDDDGRIDYILVLSIETTDRVRAEKALRESHAQLIEGQMALENKNIALSEMIDHIERGKSELILHIRANLDRVVGPVLARLESTADNAQANQLTIIRSALDDLTSPFINRLEQGRGSLTAREVEICNLIKSGCSTKEVASTLHTSEATVKTQRKIIRRKLGLVKGKDNLASYLQHL